MANLAKVEGNVEKDVVDEISDVGDRLLESDVLESEPLKRAIEGDE